MVVSRDLDKKHFDKNTIVTVGTFDGVHLGHRKIIESLSNIASENKLRKAVVTFEPHPRIVLSDNNAGIKILTTLNEK
jgi:FAD synthase